MRMQQCLGTQGKDSDKWVSTDPPLSSVDDRGEGGQLQGPPRWGEPQTTLLPPTWDETWRCLQTGMGGLNLGS